MNEKICALILAAGKGKRLKASVPKAMCKVLDHSMIEWVIGALRGSKVSDICVVINDSIDASSIKRIDKDVYICYQLQQLGTADAMSCSAGFFEGVKKISYCKYRIYEEDSTKRLDSNYILVCSVDCPCLQASTIDDFIDRFILSKARIGVIGMEPENPFGYGRLVCDSDMNLVQIVEEKDCDDQQRQIRLCNSGVIIMEKNLAFECLEKILPSNAQKEYYLTDCFKIASSMKEKIFVYKAKDYREFLGVNDQEQLKQVAGILGERLCVE